MHDKKIVFIIVIHFTSNMNLVDTSTIYYVVLRGMEVSKLNIHSI